MSSGAPIFPYHKKQRFSKATELVLVKSGDDFFKRAIDIIQRSKKTIHFQTYIFVDDSTGKSVIRALEDAVKRGVQVFLLVDGFGSNSLGSHTIIQMQEAGIHFRKFSPLFYKHHISFGRRLHHKIILGDNGEALIGGINVEDKYHIQGPETPWLDYAVYVKGEVCHEITHICEVLWKGKNRRIKRRKSFHVLDPVTENTGHIPVRVRQNDWLYKKEGISLSLRNAIRHSHSSATIMASYFLPGIRMRRLMRKATIRGVKIRVILQGVSDVKLAQKATTYLYAWLMRNNIEIYEWRNTILHGKMTLADDKWASIGSYNLNHLSDYSSIETNLEIFDSAFCEIVKEELDNVIKNSHRVTYSEYRHKMNLWEKFICWCAFYLVRFLFWLEFVIISKE